MSERWSTNDVWALAPDASSRKAAQKVAKPASWPNRGWRAADPGTDAPGGAEVVWGECRGSGSKPYQAAAHLTGSGAPAYRCSCPSRKTPCKHVLALLYLWAEGEVAEDTGPAWVGEWLTRRASAAGPRTAGAARKTPADPEAAARRARLREERVADGLAELETWLRDQVGAGLVDSRQKGYGQWDAVAARLVDAQAGRLAEQVRALAGAAAGPDWTDRLLTEYALLHLLCTGYRRRDELPEPVRATVRARIGFPPPEPDPAAAVRDHWHVLCRHDFDADRVSGRRIWLRGRDSGRTAMLLSFAGPGRGHDASIRVGTVLDAELAFHTAENRAVVTARHAEHRAAPPPGGSVADALADHARALAADPWLEAWPVVLADVVCARDGGWWLTDPAGESLPLRSTTESGWRLFGVSAGRPVTVAGEWTPDGLRPLTAWDGQGRMVPVS
ncbi:SWIM zinc finger family protein [Thermobifida halotolerans]|uniref:SWIM zinc finger family protein n=2 Tax=Thermobifida halotolerans TaxID=483545 RepID=A0AA97M552_9ACTN|nr:SWIM zinc finger family protein [Thermobifida halotolerans]UOE20642.1 SWIM zinc finger family protein [Thermobifida halotolerans]